MGRHVCQGEPIFYTKEETAVLLEMAKDDPIYIPILLAVFYGLRRSEVLGNFSTTADIYSHIDFSAKLQSAEAIGKALSG